MDRKCAYKQILVIDWSPLKLILMYKCMRVLIITVNEKKIFFGRTVKFRYRIVLHKY